MLLGQWLGSVLHVFFSAVILLVRLQQGHPACETLLPLISKDARPESGGR